MASNTVWIVSYLRGQDRSWPYDVGDDPSFRKYFAGVGPLSWGVCRQDVRNNLAPGDLVVFFCADRGSEKTEYSLSAFAQVRTRVKQTEIWKLDDLAHFRSYQNLLIAPHGDRYVHFEPVTKKKCWHADWVWRIADHAGTRKAQNVGSSTELPKCFQCASNYVVFDDAKTFVLLEPPVIAVATGSIGVENWKCDEMSMSFRGLILGPTPQRNLRTTNSRQPHRHIKIVDQDADWWLSNLEKRCHRFSVSWRVPEVSPHKS